MILAFFSKKTNFNYFFAKIDLLGWVNSNILSENNLVAPKGAGLNSFRGQYYY